jgi:(2Fe-2S) ferredoxin/predicted O-methyltransferase YrrM
MEPFRYHAFVCTQTKPEGVTSCSASGSKRVLDALNREVQSQGLENEVQITTCGCLGLCDQGPIVIIYPDGVWYRQVTPADVPEIVSSHLAAGNVVARLEWTDATAMKLASLEHREHVRTAQKAREQAGILPEELDNLIRGYWPSRAMLTALELDLFTAVGDGASAEVIAGRLKTRPRATEMLLNALASLQLLQKTDDSFQNAAASARFFSQSSKDNARGGLLHMANIWHNWSNLTECVRQGTSVKTAKPAGDWTQNFIVAMDRIANERARHLLKALGSEGIRRILDLGGGSGAYSIAFARANPGVQAEILDIQEVVPLTRDYVSKAGFADRIKVRAGDMMSDDFGHDHDLVLLNAICHMFSEEQNRALFRRAYDALGTNGRLVVQDFILERDKTSPQFAALFALNMLVGTEVGSSYSEPEYADWLHAAGFKEVTRVRLPGPSDLMIATKL